MRCFWGNAHTKVCPFRRLILRHVPCGCVLCRREEEDEKTRELEASRRVEAMERTKARAAMQATRRAMQMMEESEYVHRHGLAASACWNANAKSSPPQEVEVEVEWCASWLIRRQRQRGTCVADEYGS